MTPRVRQYAAEEGARLGLAATDVLARRRGTPDAARARWGVMRRLRADGFTLNQIAHWMGRHHTTVLHGLRARGNPQTAGCAVTTKGNDHAQT